MSAASPEQVYQEALKLLQQDALEPARLRLEALAKAVPKEALVHVQLGLIAQKQDRQEDAVKAFARAHRLRPSDLKMALLYSDALVAAARVKDAVTLLRRLRRAAPRAVPVLAKLGHALQLSGDFQAADVALSKALDIAPDDAELYRILSVSRRFEASDPLIGKMEALFAQPNLSAPATWNLGYALAKAMDDTKAYDRVFDYLTPASAAMRSTYPFDRAERAKEISALDAAWTGVDFNIPLASTPEDAPIFITGLPRSGTTLIEQILAAHPKVMPIGEPGFALQETYKLLQSETGDFSALSERLDALPDAVGRGYVARVRKRFGGAKIPADKSIQTYMVIGALALALPNARFLIVDRDPRDNLLSIYRNLFAPGRHRYAYDFEDLVFYRRTMREVVAAWEQRLEGRVAHVSYDALVTNPDGEAKALVAAAGLDWDERCLRFHENKGAVSSLSVAQVRRPIYKSSKSAWERYGGAVQPLIDALEQDGQL